MLQLSNLADFEKQLCLNALGTKRSPEALLPASLQGAQCSGPRPPSRPDCLVLATISRAVGAVCHRRTAIFICKYLRCTAGDAPPIWLLLSKQLLVKESK